MLIFLATRDLLRSCQVLFVHLGTVLVYFFDFLLFWVLSIIYLFCPYNRFLIPIQKRDKQIIVKDENKLGTEPLKEQCNEQSEENNCFQENGNESFEPPKRKKLKGQNKARPRTVPNVDRSCRLCPAVLREEVCSFGEKCAFSHDVDKYVSTRPPDIDDFCINFELTGKCRYAVECRYSKNHLTADYKNIIDQQKFQRYTATKKHDNTLSKDLMVRLRKKQYKFPKTDRFLDSIKNDGNPVKPTYEFGTFNTSGVITDEDVVSLRQREKKKV